MSEMHLTSEMMELIERERAKKATIVMEVMQDVFHRLPWNEEIPMSDGRVFRLTRFVEPNDGTGLDRSHPEYGVPNFGFDVVLPDGHIEFSVTKTGWGSSL